MVESWMRRSKDERIVVPIKVKLVKEMQKCIALEYPNRNKSLPCSLDLGLPGINRLSLEVRRILHDAMFFRQLYAPSM